MITRVRPRTSSAKRLRIGLISDTHGLLRPEAIAFLQGCDHIVHAGDIMGGEILEALAAIAPLTAVRGNNDFGDWADALHETQTVRLGDMVLYALHDLAQLRTDPPPKAARIVVSGHSHKPLVALREGGESGNGGVLFVNPGSAGPRRFTLPISIGEAFIDGESVSARVVDLVTGKELGNA